MAKHTRTKYKILQIREDDFNKFETRLTEMREIHPYLSGVEFFKLILNFWNFHNEDELKRDLEHAHRVKQEYEFLQANSEVKQK